MNKGALALAVVGGVFVVISLLTIAVTILLTATSNGRIDPDESAPVMGGGGCCCFLSFAMLAVGVVWLISSRKSQH
ncbi:MAG: hypothetical protein QGG36_25055 [Pirellulaceae bacterium]|nr:hypothetical protein [Pirellulaceae bacterium]